MTLQQLEYILALDKTRHFVRAAEMCGITQPTLSAMVQKLEDELDSKIFDRAQHPLETTEIGQKILKQAQIIMFHVNQLIAGVDAEKGSLAGTLNLAVIPTVAPYLLPGFIGALRQDYPSIALKISEMRTETILEKLRLAEIDMAILATPLNNPNFLEIPLYYEHFVAYISPSESIYQREELSATDMPLDRLWVLEEGHCLRNQVFNFCEKETSGYVTTYEAGSIDTLVKIVDTNGGYTIIPELHVDLLSEEQKKNLRSIVNPETTREISIIIRNDFVREGMLNAVAESIKKIIPNEMLNERLKKFRIRI
jgi:LysR family hydrogen peroxide-inducible transcriptional activator